MNEIQLKRRSSRWHYRYKLRREQAISGYLKVAAPQLHNEAVEFSNSIQHLYPPKKDLMKTQEFKQFKKSKQEFTNKKRSNPTRSRIHNSNKQLALNIELLHPNEIHIEQDIVNIQTTINNQDVPFGPEQDQTEIISTSILDDSELCELNTAFSNIPQHIMNEMLKDINNDPDLKDILNQFNSDNDDLVGIDIDIDNETELEKELNNIFS